MWKWVIGVIVLVLLGGGGYFWMQQQAPNNQDSASGISFKTKVGTPATITLKVGETATDGEVEIKLDKLDTNRFGQPIATTYVSADVNHDAYSLGGSFFGTTVGGIVGVKEGFLDSAASTGVIIVKVTDISLSNNTVTLEISAGQK